ncbi:MAG: acyltransferase [Sphingomonadales bacterium]|nr:acyltransferase [Sphingomonadales bacterium]
MTKYIHGLSGKQTVQDVLDANRGAGPGFDFWRFFLSSSVIFLHSFHVCYGVHNGGDRVLILNPFFGMILPIFFGLSGFLVAGSAIRTENVGIFISFRAIRLVPALAVEVTLSALIVGPLLTTVSLKEYFISHKFFIYWGNIIGRVRYQLPGLFEHNPVALTVNENLWTLHAELECYVIMSIFMISGIIHRRLLSISVWALATLIMAIMSFEKGWFLRGSIYPASVFVYSFCTGVVAFLWRDKIILSKLVLIFSIISYIVFYYFRISGIIAILPLIYIMIWVGSNEKFKFNVLNHGDYSYGLYLYGFVIQKTLILLLPRLREWWFVFPTSLIITLIFSMASWNFVEKPALKMKKYISRRGANPASPVHGHEQRKQEMRRLKSDLI